MVFNVLDPVKDMLPSKGNENTVKRPLFHLGMSNKIFTSTNNFDRSIQNSVIEDSGNFLDACVLAVAPQTHLLVGRNVQDGRTVELAILIQ